MYLAHSVRRLSEDTVTVTKLVGTLSPQSEILHNSHCPEPGDEHR